jgi:hypothetical protein
MVVYNMNGQKVADFSSRLSAGKVVRIAWKTLSLPNGVYLAKLTAGKNQIIRRLTLVR